MDFPTKREFLHKYYKDNNNIKFNINVDDKTMKKIKVMQKRAGHITSNIKNETDNQKRAKKPQNQMPVSVYGQNPMMMPPGMGGMGMPMPNMPNMPNMSNMPNMPPPMGVRTMPPGPGYMGQPPTMGIKQQGNMMPPQNMDSAIAKNIQDKAKLVDAARDPAAEKNIKGTLSHNVRFVLASKLGMGETEAYQKMSTFLFI